MFPPPRAARLSGRPFPRRPLAPAVAAVVLLGAVVPGTVYVTARAHGADGPVSSSASSGTTPDTATDTHTHTHTDRGGNGDGDGETEAGTAVEAVTAAGPAPPAGADRDALLAAAVGGIATEAGARVSVAVLDPESGDSAVYGQGAFDTASIVKVDILAALLLRARDAGRGLTAQERTYAAAMIRDSDNASASALWEAIGRAPGLAEANERLGLTATEGGDGPLWGLTRTTAADQLTLLRQVFGEDSALDADGREYLRELMGGIAEGQDWGVSAAGSAGSALKNGWLPRSATGLWDVNSVGRVVADGRAYLVAVLSDGNSTKAAGIALVEAAAKAAVSVLTGG